jgi:ABC-2 type transport system permease protein
MMTELLADVRTVVWKEWAEFARQRSTVIGMLFFVAVFGIFIPVQRGREWLTSGIPFLNAALFPATLALGVVADSFAGERERHTLETLLASRLPDHAILLGKFTAIVGYVWGLTVASLLAAAVAVNVAEPTVGLAFYPARLLVSGLVFGALSAGLAAGAGILVSLRAATVRQAAQMLTIGLMGLIFVGVAAASALPDGWKHRLIETVRGLGPTATVLLAGAALLLVDGVLLAVAALRFRRTRLLLD